MSSTVFKFFILASLFVFSGCATPQVKNQSPQTNSTFADIIATFEEEKRSPYSILGNDVCAVDVLWEQPAAKQMRIVVFAATTCTDVVVKENDLYSASGQGPWAHLFQLEKDDKTWKVVDWDDADLPGQTKKPWVVEHMKLIPEEAKQKFDPIRVSALLSEKAGKIFNIPVPQYTFASCRKDTDCASNEVCVEHGPFNQGSSKCMKSCASFTECGNGYGCRGICAKGENGCPYTMVNVCHPDLPAESLDKKTQPW